MAPAGTPSRIVDKLQHEIASIYADPVIFAKLDKAGLFPTGSKSPAEFDAFIRSEKVRWGTVIKSGTATKTLELNVTALGNRRDAMRRLESMRTLALPAAARAHEHSSRRRQPPSRRKIRRAPSASWCRSRPAATPTGLAAMVAKYLSEELHQRVFVENRRGAGGILGSAEVARSAPDGTTLLISSLASQVVTPLINPKAAPDAVAAFTHIAYIGGPPNCFVVPSNSKLHTIDDILTATKAAPLTSVRPASARSGISSSNTSRTKPASNSSTSPTTGHDRRRNHRRHGRFRRADFVDLGEQRRGRKNSHTVRSRRRNGCRTIPTCRRSVIRLRSDRCELARAVGARGPAGCVVQRINHAVNEALAQPEVRTTLRGSFIEPEFRCARKMSSSS